MNFRNILILTLGSLLAGLAATAMASPESLQIALPPTVSSFEYKVLGDHKLLITALDQDGNPVKNLTREDFNIVAGNRKTRIVSVENLETSQDVGLNIVLVADNSLSMRHRRAVEAALQAMESILRKMRPIDTVSVVVFHDDQTMSLGGRDLHVKTMQSNNPIDLRRFLAENYDRGLTYRTFLFEAIYAGIELMRAMPADEHKFMVIFSDGEDINSTFKAPVVNQAAAAVENFQVFAIDYMPGDKLDPFLSDFSRNSGGQAWKATHADDLIPIFEEVSSRMLQHYVVVYRPLVPPQGELQLLPDSITVEEVTTIDSSPMLNHVYFATGQSAIPDRYALFNRQEETRPFAEESLRGSSEKHLNILNIVGQRLRAYPSARVTLTGCNSNHGPERNRTDLSRARAEAVRAYLHYIWGIELNRLEVVARNLPASPSSDRLEAGREENQRVEIHADRPEILAPVRSTFIDTRSDLKELRLLSRVQAEHGLSSWNLSVNSRHAAVHTASGTDLPPAELLLTSQAFQPEQLTDYGQLQAHLLLTDTEGHTLNLLSDPVTINFVQREELKARDSGYMVEEKYALILFDFDSADLKAGNAAIVQQIVDRIRQIDRVAVQIVGHTDNIGSDAYNIQLSQRRARAVYDQLTTAVGAQSRVAFEYKGNGPFEAPHNNDLPENRSMNRTVTILLTYEQKF